MIIPAYLKKGDVVGIVSPSRKISAAEIANAVEVIEGWGMKVVLAKHAFASYHQFAGKDEQRIADFQEMLDNDEVKAVFCSRGGYGSVRIIDKLDFSAFRESPKWIVGFSDITVFHSHINKNFGIATLHCEVPLNFGNTETHPDSLETIRKALTGARLEYREQINGLFVEGKVSGILTGGNLSVIYSLLGSVSETETSGKILFLEDLDEYLYHVDRMILALKRAGKFNKIKALILGGMSGMRDNPVPFGKTAEEIIFEHTGDSGIPVVCNFPAGHLSRNLAMRMGATVCLEVTKKTFSIVSEA